MEKLQSFTFQTPEAYEAEITEQTVFLHHQRQWEIEHVAKSGHKWLRHCKNEGKI